MTRATFLPTGTFLASGAFFVSAGGSPWQPAGQARTAASKRPPTIPARGELKCFIAFSITSRSAEGNDGETEGQRDGETEGRRDGETERRRDRGTERQRDRGIERRRTVLSLRLSV